MNSPWLAPYADRRASSGTLVLPVADGRVVAADLAAAPVVGWFRALAQWAESGRTLDGGVVPRLSKDQVVEVCRLLAPGDTENADASASLADTVLRWAMQARLLRLYGGVLRTVKNAAELCVQPDVLWFRALNALVRPDLAFTDVLGEYAGARVWCHDLSGAVEDFLKYCSPQDSGRPDAVCSSPGSRLGDGLKAASWLAASLGLVTGSPDARGEAAWEVTGVGRVLDTLARLPFETVSGEDSGQVDGDLCLIAQPDGPEPGFVVKVALEVGRPVWRRLRIPGELTVEGLHLAIQTAFGWDGDHLHKFTAGPYTLAAVWTRLDAIVPADLVTVTDLATLGVRALHYVYDLGDSWRHTVTVETVLPPGSVGRPACVGGAGTTPAEDGEGWLEDEDGGYRPDPDYVPPVERTYDRDRITAALAALMEA